MTQVPKKRDRLLDLSSLRSNVKSLSPLHLLLFVLITLLVIAYVITRSTEVLAIVNTLVTAFLITLGVPIPGTPHK